jgi:hypothetical protein
MTPIVFVVKFIFHADTLFLCVLKVSTMKRWFEVSTGQTLFHITRDPYSYNKYAEAQLEQSGMEFFTNKESSAEVILYFCCKSEIRCEFDGLCR